MQQSSLTISCAVDVRCRYMTECKQMSEYETAISYR